VSQPSNWRSRLFSRTASAFSSSKFLKLLKLLREFDTVNYESIIWLLKSSPLEIRETYGLKGILEAKRLPWDIYYDVILDRQCGAMGYYARLPIPAERLMSAWGAWCAKKPQVHTDPILYAIWATSENAKIPFEQREGRVQAALLEWAWYIVRTRARCQRVSENR